MASPSLTGRTFANSVMLLIGAIASGETGTAAEISDVLARTNSLIDAWSTQALTALVNERHVLPLTSGTASYELGPTSTTLRISSGLRASRSCLPAERAPLSAMGTRCSCPAPAATPSLAIPR